MQNLKSFLKSCDPALGKVIFSIGEASIEISRAVRRAGLMSLLGQAGETNVQGEEVQKLDIYSDQVFDRVVSASGEVFSFACEERDVPFAATGARDGAAYVVGYDPLDGSSNIDVNVAVGTIWGAYKRTTKGAFHAANISDFVQGGRKQVAAGYTVYGASTMFVFTTGSGVNGFTFDEESGEFVLTHPNFQMPKTGKIYSCNEGNANSWSAALQQLVAAYKSGEKPLSARYVGSMVADFQRTIIKGGIFFYPADQKNKRGKLRYLYECAPMAFVTEQAGGRATDGEKNILDLVPTAVHERVPLFIGSSEMVEKIKL